MFGGAKPTFGAGTGATGFGTFTNTAAATPFGQSAFGKPATPAFGGTSAFGAPPTQNSMFGSAAAPNQPTGGLFGGATTSSAFGGTTTTPNSFGAFSQPQQTSNIFGSSQSAPNTSLFGQAANSAFGAAKPATMGFGQTPAAQPTTSLFGQTTAATSSSGFGSFGQAAPTTTNVFGSGAASAFGQPQSVTVGAVGGGVNPGTSLIKYQPTIGTDTLMKAGQPNNVSTKQHCITAMKEYEMKSLEELRMEDYLSSRKGPQAGSAPGAFGFGSPATNAQPASTGLFGSSAQQQQPGSGLFGQTGQENKSLFGTSAFGQPPATSAFGSPAQQNNFMQKPFGAPTNTAFGATTTDASNPFGAKPVGFGQTGGSMFGQPVATSAAPAFGQTNTGFGGFGSQAGQPTQQTSLFGSTNATDPNKPAFGLGAPVSAPNTGFGGFGAPATSTAGGSLFGSKPATSFAAPAFGASSTANTGFGNFSLSNTNAGTGGSLFNSNMNKPPTSAFGGFGTTSAAPLNFNTGNTGGSIFSNAAKPGGSLFGGSTALGGVPGAGATGGGLFGSAGTTGAFGTTLGGGFGQIGGGNTALSGMGIGAQPVQGVVVVPIHQQILSKVTSPYGDTPIFKDLKRNDDVDATRATNPAAQQAVMDMNSNKFRVSTKESPISVRVKAMGNLKNRKSMFDGLEEFDGSVEGFNLKPNAKRLVIKPKVKITTNGSESSPAANNSNPRQLTALRAQRESFNSAIAKETLPVVNRSPAEQNKDVDTSRRESWLHPNNLEKVRQHNLQSNIDQAPLNSTLTELVPRKPLETYNNAATGRLSVSTIPENPFEDQATNIARRDTFTSEHGNESTLSIRSQDGERRLAIEAPADAADVHDDADNEPHPTGIILRRMGYYTLPTLDDLKSYLAEDGSCIVPNFTIGREGYGNVYFGKEMDVAGLNLDEIVHFRNKEVIIYPDDNNKPSIGNGLNRDAQVTLDQVWPVDKTKHEAIKDPQRLIEIDWEAKLRRVCDKNSTRFIEYRPETGSWVFRVKHFSKYGLNDSDEEDEELPTDPKKAKITAIDAQRQGVNSTDKMTLTSLRTAQKISEEAARSMDPKTLAAGVINSFRPMDNSAEFMMMDKTQFFQAGSGNDFSMFDAPLARTMTSPTVTLAKEVVGNNPHKMQLMKSSLFVEDDGNDDAIGSQPIFAQSQLPRSSHVFNRELRSWKDGAGSETSSDYGQQSPLLGVSSTASVASIIREVQSEETSSVAAESIIPVEKKQVLGGLKPFSFVIKPRVAPLKVFASTVPLERSIAYGLYDQWISDLGFYKGRGFKLSFGPQNTLMVPNSFNNLRSARDVRDNMQPAAIVFEPRASNDFSPNLLQLMKLNSVNKYEDFSNSIVPHLEVQLKFCLSHDVEGSECPWLQSNNGGQLIAKHLSEAIKLGDCSSTGTGYAVSVWSLLFALWGEHEELIGQETNSHFAVMCRRNLLSEWLENTLVSKDLFSKKISSNSYLDHMLELLCCHRVTEACELAFKYDDANLALILSQLSSGAVVRILLEEQLFAWQQSKSDKYISLERLKMFMLAAGVPLMQSSQGAINLLDDISWITVLALQLWYFTSPTSSITDAVLEYDKAYQAEECYAEAPRPSYKDTINSSQSIVYDLRYHLLQLYSHRTHSLEQALNPITHTPDPMDFRLSWLVLQTLEALDYNHITPLTDAQFHVDFASQLENEGLWHWTIFVQLHIKDRNQRERAVQHTLQRYVSVSTEEAFNEEEQFVIQQLGVPESWVDYAKSLKAGAMGDHHLQAKYLLQAKHWVLAHEVIFQYIAPDAVINNKLEYLYHLLSQFECIDDSSQVKVPNWTNQGQIFLDYIDIKAKFKQIHNVNSIEDIHARWENLKPQLSEICSRITLLPCPTSKHRLCQCEISKSLSCLVQGMCIVSPELEPCAVLKMSLERLPMAQEFSSKELGSLLDELMNKIENQMPFIEAPPNRRRVLMKV